MLNLRTMLVGLVALFASAMALAEETWTLTTVDLKRQAVTLKALDGQSVTVAMRDGDKTLTMDEFVQLDRGGAAAEAAGTFSLYLHGGDRVGGEPAGVANEQLKWTSPVVGELKIPVRQLSVLVKGPGPAPELDRPGAQDVVKLANGDRVEGTVTNLEADKITLVTGGDTVPVPLDNVTAVYFASPGQTKATGERGWRIRLSDGSSFVAADVKLKEIKLALTMADKSSRELDPAGVTMIEQVNGPLVWLSLLKPIEDKQVSQFDLSWPTRMDKTVTGKPIRYDRVYERGIGVHARSALVFALDGKFQAFRTQFGIDGQADLADVTVRIRLDDREVYRQDKVRAGKLWPAIVVDLGQAKALTLDVDFGQNGDVQDRFNWVEPALLRKMPASQPATQP